mmetsp:Transcript_11469/g.21864  ORF Transcript_11469/g.21864 Transcript_11469/m.21864 type:complete len:80 (-) Transcript_11469:61-300(-)
MPESKLIPASQCEAWDDVFGYRSFQRKKLYARNMHVDIIEKCTFGVLLCLCSSGLGVASVCVCVCGAEQYKQYCAPPKT